MTKRARFLQSLHAGTGRAWLLLKENPELRVKEELALALRTDYAIDRQSGDDRTEYLFRLANISPWKEHLVKETVALLGRDDIDGWDLIHLFGVARLFATEGSEAVRDAMYARYTSAPHQDRGYCADEIIQLDGVEGLLFVVEEEGKYLAEHPDYYVDTTHLSTAQWRLGRDDLKQVLEQVAGQNESIRRYLDAVEAHSANQTTLKPDREQPFDRVRSMIRRKFWDPRTKTRIEDLTPEEIDQLAESFEAESDPVRQEKYLRLFSSIKYPRPIDPIFDIVKGRASRRGLRLHWACHALSNFQDESIRTFAIDKLSHTNQPTSYLYLLISNYQMGDARLLTRLATRYKHPEFVHDLMCAYAAIYKANSTPECRDPLEILYHKGRCGMHRLMLLEILHANDLLSDEIKEEMPYDSFEGVREMYAEKFKEG